MTMDVTKDVDNESSKITLFKDKYISNHRNRSQGVNGSDTNGTSFCSLHCQQCKNNSSYEDGSFPKESTASKSLFCHEKGQTVDNSVTLMRKIAQLCKSEELSDIQLVVAGKRYFSHKLLLCCSSDVFRIMLTNPSWPDAQKNEIILKEEPECIEVFEIFLQYLYSGCIQLSHYNVLPILMLADKYNVTHLRHVCIDYMCSHIVSTTDHNHAVSWLQYAYLCGHQKLAETCRHFILCNYHKVMSTADYLIMEKDVLVDFLLDSNLVIPDEFTLFQGVIHWLQNQKTKTIEVVHGESWKDSILQILSHIRFPMMTLSSLCQLEKEAVTNDFHSFFVDKIGRAMKYHSSTYEGKKGLNAKLSESQQLQCHPRNYTNEMWSKSLSIDDFPTVPLNDARPLSFTSRVSGSEADKNKTWEWNVELYPKGVKFQKCFMIGLWRNIEISGSTYKTVRLVLETKSIFPRDVEVAVLVTGVQDSVEHVKNIIVKRCLFDKTTRMHHFNDIVPYDELNCEKSDYLTGSEGSSFKITIIVKPV